MKMNEQTNQQTDFAEQLITKQDAIKAVTYGALSSATLFGRSDAGMTALRETVRAIKQLPTAQPEIIRCRDCKHYHYANRVPQEQMCTCEIDGNIWSPDSYCSFAEREEDE